MKTLIVEDDFTSRVLLNEILQGFGPTHVAVNGQEACDAVRVSLESGQPYNLICLDIMLPEKDGQQVLKEVRAMEEAKGITSTFGAKIVMTTALNNLKNVSTAYSSLCDAYLVKPIRKAQLFDELRKLKLIP